MSYSFGVRAKTKVEALEKVNAELNKVVAQQKAHEKDSVHASETATSFVNVLAEPSEEQDVVVSVSGSLGWLGTSGVDEILLVSAQVSVSASLQPKQ